MHSFISIHRYKFIYIFKIFSAISGNTADVPNKIIDQEISLCVILMKLYLIHVEIYSVYTP